MTRKKRVLRSFTMCRATVMGRHRSTLPKRSGYPKFGGITPMTVTGSALSLKVRPRIAESPPKRDCQSSWLKRATWFRPGTPSSAVKGRPRAGCTRKVVKKSTVASIAFSRSAGFPGSDIVLPQNASAVRDWSGAFEPSAAAVATRARISSVSTKAKSPRLPWGVVP